MAANIVLAVRETQYIEPLLHYLHQTEYGQMLKVKAFSRMDVFAEYMQGGERPDALVGDAAFIEAWLVGGGSAVPWAILEEDGMASSLKSKSAADGKRIAKYQALPALLSSIMQLCEVRRQRAAIGPNEGTLLLGVVSGSGSSGKTTVAMNMAKQLGGQGLSVFYLNLETVDSSGLFLHPPGGSEPGLERLLYEIQASRDVGGSTPEIGVGRFAVRLDALHCDTFRPVGNVKEMLQMSARDAGELMELLVADGGYDIVIVDTGSIGEERAAAVVQRCGRLVWVLRDDEASIYKAGRWLAHFTSPHSGLGADVSAKSLVAVNFVKEGAPQVPLPEGVSSDVLLPFISSWSLPHRGELSLNSPLFQRGILQLCRSAGIPMPLVSPDEASHE